MPRAFTTGSTVGERRRAWSQVALVLVLLLGFDWLMREVFFARSIMPRFVAPYPILRDRTFSQNWSILFGSLERLPRPDLRVAVLGDSTMYATEPFGDEACLALFLRTELRRRHPGLDVEVADLSQLGLFTTDIALLMSKLARADVDAIVLGATLRAFPTRPEPAYLSSLPAELGVTDLARLLAAEGAPWLRATIGIDALATGLVHSGWALWEYRLPLRQFVWRRAVLPLLGERLAAADGWKPGYQPQRIIEPQPAPGARYHWMRDAYEPPNANWQALATIGRLCERYGPRPCLLYAGPVNPSRPDLVEPALYDEYVARLRAVAAAHGMIWRDFSHVLTADEFRKPTIGRIIDPIHMSGPGGAKLAGFIADALAAAGGTRP